MRVSNRKKSKFSKYYPILGVFTVFVAVFIYVLSEKASVNQVASGGTSGQATITTKNLRVKSKKVITGGFKSTVDSCLCAGSTLKCYVTYRYPWNLLYNSKKGTITYGGCLPCDAGQHACYLP